jgi:molybdate transport system regulatory protein
MPLRLKLKAQLYCGDQIAMGPGKANLLDAINRTGSISAAGRELGMSYRRSWMLVDTMNKSWREPLVTTVVGGRSGATLSNLGHEILTAYRSLEHELENVASSAAAKRLLAALEKDKDAIGLE